MRKFQVLATAAVTVQTVVEAENEEQAKQLAQQRALRLDGSMEDQLQNGSAAEGWTYWGIVELEDLDAEEV